MYIYICFYVYFYLLSTRGQLHQIACDKWQDVDEETKQSMARMAAASAWGLGKQHTHAYLCFFFFKKGYDISFLGVAQTQGEVFCMYADNTDRMNDDKRYIRNSSK